MTFLVLLCSIELRKTDKRLSTMVKDYTSKGSPTLKRKPPCKPIDPNMHTSTRPLLHGHGSKPWPFSNPKRYSNILIPTRFQKAGCSTTYGITRNWHCSSDYLLKLAIRVIPKNDPQDSYATSVPPLPRLWEPYRFWPQSFWTALTSPHRYTDPSA